MLRRTLTTLLLLGLMLSSGVLSAFDSRDYIERSVGLIQESKYSLARTYLNPAIIDYRLHGTERSRAYYLRGFSYFAQGLFVSAGKDYHRALEFNAENPGALAALGDLYFRGVGVRKNLTLAVQLFERAAELGHKGARFQLGFAHLEGLGAPQDMTIARQWLEEAAGEGNTTAMAYLGRSYRAGYAEPPEPEKAQAWYDKALAAGSQQARVALAFMHQNGELGEPDPARAAELFAQAAEAGSSAAQVSLGHLYLTGSGVEEDPAAARKYFDLAATQGNAAGYLGLGHLYEAGAGVAEDRQQARALYEKAAARDLGPAQMRLSYLLLADGETAEAMGWLKRAAAQDMVEAHNDYAWMLATASEAHLRNGELALEHAQRAVAEMDSPAYLDTLAAAYAELGRFTEAIATQEQAIAQLEDSETELLQELQTHLAAYQAGEPWRD